MKKLIIATALLLPISAFAAWVGPGAATLTTAATVSTAADDAPVKLEGHIARQISGDKFEFKDATGAVTLEIDRKVWPAEDITPAHKVRLTGKVDKSIGGLAGTEVEVKTLEVLK